MNVETKTNTVSQDLDIDDIKQLGLQHCNHMVRIGIQIIAMVDKIDQEDDAQVINKYYIEAIRLCGKLEASQEFLSKFPPVANWNIYTGNINGLVGRMNIILHEKGLRL